MRFEELGTRMKSYEQQITSQRLIPMLPVYARIDGRAFHTFCKGLQKPFCMELVETMQEVCKHLVFETKAQLGYVQSDEISLCWLSPEKAPFDGKIYKLQSVLPSIATSKFITYIFEKQYNELKQRCQRIIPSFDCRICQLPNEIELADMFVWRELDAVRNSVQMLAQSQFSHNSLQGLNSKQLQDKLLTEKDINWNELQDELKRGTYYNRINIERELPDEIWNKIPEDKKPETRKVIRTIIEKYELPIIKNVLNKSGVYFYNETPQMKQD